MDLKNVIDGDFEDVKDEDTQKGAEPKKKASSEKKSRFKKPDFSKMKEKLSSKKPGGEKEEKQKKKPSRAKEVNAKVGKKKMRFKHMATLFTILAVLVVFGFLYLINDFYIEYLWFKEVGYTNIYFMEIKTKLLIGLPFFIIVFVLSSLYFDFLFRIIRIGYNKVGKIGKMFRRMIAFLYSITVSGVFIYKLWYKFLQYRYAVPFKQADAQFGKDISFYVFKLPFFMTLTKLLFASILLLFALTMLIFFGLRASGKKTVIMPNEKKKSRREKLNIFLKMWDYVKVPFSVFLCALSLLFAVFCYLKTFDILYSKSGIVYGATYSDVTITLLMYRIMMILSAVLAVFSLVFGLANRLKQIFIVAALIPAVFFGMGIVKQGVEKFIVVPNEYNTEQKYIANNISMTRKAYNIDEVDVKSFEGDNKLTAKKIADNSLTVNNIPINNFDQVLDTYNSLQSFRSYYKFVDTDVDRYTLGKTNTQLFLSVREMTSSSEDTVRTWVNKHKKYTHGYGTVASPVTKTDESGQPVLIQENIPTKTKYDELKLSEPRVYYGENTEDYVIVKCKSREFDYPQGDDNVENRYEGEGGIPLSLYNRLAFSLHNMSTRLIFSLDINSESRIMIRRQVMERVQTIAPFLHYDKDPYIVIADGKLYWIVDAFTTTNKYPYSTPSKLEDGTKFNYIRNSVKVVVDAYDGSVDFYQVEKNDPIISAYAKLYPGFVKPMSKMSKSLRKHLRYSEMLFNIQADVYETYHMTNPQVFYNKEDMWQVAKQFYGTDKKVVNVNSTYLIMKLPGKDKEEFIIMAPFTPKGKNNMVAWMSGSCDGKNYGKLTVYKLPKQKLTYGPMQIEQRIDQNTTIAPQLNLLSQQSSSVARGNMLTIPIENSILYVEPIYVKSSTDEQAIPEVKEVIVAYGNKIVMKDSLKEALDAIFKKGEGEVKVTDAKP